MIVVGTVVVIELNRHAGGVVVRGEAVVVFRMVMPQILVYVQRRGRGH